MLYVKVASRGSMCLTLCLALKGKALTYLGELARIFDMYPSCNNNKRLNRQPVGEVKIYTY